MRTVREWIKQEIDLMQSEKVSHKPYLRDLLYDAQSLHNIVDRIQEIKCSSLSISHFGRGLDEGEKNMLNEILAIIKKELGND